MPTRAYPSGSPLAIVPIESLIKVMPVFARLTWQWSLANGKEISHYVSHISKIVSLWEQADDYSWVYY